MTFIAGDSGHIAEHNRLILLPTGSWTAYTPTWTGSGSNPALLNGTIVGRYLTRGKNVQVAIDLTIGSTTTMGTGFYSLSLPSTAANLGIHRLGVAAFFDTSLTGWSHGWTQVTANTATVSAFLAYPPSSASTFSANQWSATHPVAPASGDVFRFDFEYESA